MEPRTSPMVGEAVANGIIAYAKRQGWSKEKIDRIDNVLYNLGLDNFSPLSDGKIGKVWEDVKTHTADAEIIRAASRGKGTGYPGAGLQTNYNDCAIFALANAARLPYGVVAARAAEIIRQAEWRTPEERANPQKTIEKIGLNGGEVIVLAEAFGKAEIVKPRDFAPTIKAGKTVLVNLAPGHEVVLTKVFSRKGETWYEIINSLQGPEQRQYLSNKELNMLLLEKGVSFTPDPGTVPKLLR